MIILWDKRFGDETMKRETKLAAAAIFEVVLLAVTLVIYLVMGVREPSIWFGLFLNAFFLLYVFLAFKFVRRKERKR